jgi:hypothetical protein
MQNEMGKTKDRYDEISKTRDEQTRTFNVLMPRYQEVKVRNDFDPRNNIGGFNAQISSGEGEE